MKREAKVSVSMTENPFRPVSVANRLDFYIYYHIAIENITFFCELL